MLHPQQQKNNYQQRLGCLSPAPAGKRVILIGCLRRGLLELAAGSPGGLRKPAAGLHGKRTSA